MHADNERVIDAKDAGGPHSELCTLIIVEGDSARLAAEVVHNVQGRQRFGILVLR